MNEVPVPFVQLAPLLVLNCHEAPDSKPETMTVPTFVMPSTLLEPVSLVSAKVGAAGAVASTVIAEALEPGELVLPARSIWRTWTTPAVYVPEGSVKDVPVPFVHVPPLLVLNCHEAPVSMPPTFTVPSVVTPSEPLEPVSFASENVGAAGAVLSTVIAALLEPIGLVLPARSVCWACRAPAA